MIKIIGILTLTKINRIIPLLAELALAVICFAAFIICSRSYFKKHVVFMIFAYYQALIFFGAMVMDSLQWFHWSAKSFFGYNNVFGNMSKFTSWMICTVNYWISITIEVFPALPAVVVRPSKSRHSSMMPMNKLIRLSFYDSLVSVCHLGHRSLFSTSTFAKTFRNFLICDILVVSHDVYSSLVDRLVRAVRMLQHPFGLIFISET